MKKSTKSFLILSFFLILYLVGILFFYVQFYIFEHIEYFSEIGILLYVFSLTGIFFFRKKRALLFLPAGVFLLVFGVYIWMSGVPAEYCQGYLFEKKDYCDCQGIEKSNWGGKYCIGETKTCTYQDEGYSCELDSESKN